MRCGHCKRLAPTWAQLAELLNSDAESRVKIAKVDCTENAKTCTDNDITSYPTLKFFHHNSDDEPVKYRSARDLPALTQFINDQLGSSLSDEEKADTPEVNKKLVELNDFTFNVHVSKGKHFVKFYAPWCGMYLPKETLFRSLIFPSILRSLPKISSNMGGTGKFIGWRKPSYNR